MLHYSYPPSGLKPLGGLYFYVYVLQSEMNKKFYFINSSNNFSKLFSILEISSINHPEFSVALLNSLIFSCQPFTSKI